jgi:branched-chain amino acid transport system ATP-binding protein
VSAPSASPPAALLSVVDVHVGFGSVVALAGVSVDVTAGAITAIIGPNGAGKTTLLDTMAGRRRPDAGQVILEGRDGVDVLHGRNGVDGVAKTDQVPGFDGATPRDAVAGALRTMRPGPPGLRWLASRMPATRTTVDTLLHQAGLTETFFGQPLSELGLAEWRRVDLARALARQPRVLLLDEPASGQDRAHHETLATLLRRLARQGLGVVVVDHELDFVERVADTVLALHEGVVVARGALADVLADPTVRDVYLEGLDDIEGAEG